jgi:transposase
MAWRPQLLPPVPEATAAAVRAAFSKGNLYVDLRTAFGTLLALVMVMQYIEALTARQAADAVRRCMDWKYALSLELTAPGFDFTLLHDFFVENGSC